MELRPAGSGLEWMDPDGLDAFDDGGDVAADGERADADKLRHHSHHHQ
ncbi:hypothetical protein [Tunturiibacter gelidoferens]|uniref:Uncharacterized protein n=2 Tax=Tunturiibacter gelidiferens TaxID=3069689 RepID=A0AAU7YVL7_9BACT|nr:hypothetical protein [Edaphobacter lichenicola]MBB5339024.1 hypothetical protein [Edaphobacter lichenicola]